LILKLGVDQLAIKAGERCAIVCVAHAGAHGVTLFQQCPD